jgi:hypothetical protein
MKVIINPRIDFDAFATGTLEAKVYKTGARPGDDLEIVFIETSLGYRRQHGGPEAVVVNEFVFCCLAESVVELQRRGFKVKITRETVDE